MEWNFNFSFPYFNRLGHDLFILFRTSPESFLFLVSLNLDIVVQK